MTPPATAAAAAPRLTPGSRRRSPARPRRVSGPALSGRAATAAAVAIPAPGVALPRRRAATPKRRPARANEPRGVALRVIDAVEGISASSLLDRLIRGRLWIGLLAFALIGIVAMQLLVLKLNTGIGRKLTRVASLQTPMPSWGSKTRALRGSSHRPACHRLRDDVRAVGLRPLPRRQPG